MQAKELRIGNLVYKFGVPPAVEIIRLSKDKILIDATPITLTEEWLKRFGCLPNDTDDSGNINYWNKEKDFSVDMELFRTSTGIESILSYVICSNRKKQITYVHQLQNLYYALTGEELTLKDG